MIDQNGSTRVFFGPADTEVLVFDDDKTPIALGPDGAGPMVELPGVVDARCESEKEKHDG